MPSTARDEAPSPGTLLAGRWRVLGRLGAGGMATVLLAEDAWRGGARVAIKCAPDGDPALRGALLAEHARLRRLRHPQVVRAREIAWDGPRRLVFYAMDHVEGEPLDGAARGPGDAADLLAQAADALAYVHARRIAHGDVKAENLLAVRDAGPGAPRVLLVDFGLARSEAEAVAGSGFSGTLTHAAPELLAGEPASPASDLYALGVTAHALLAGRPPFGDEDPVALAEAHRHRLPPALDGVPRACSDVVARLLAKLPARRPEGAALVAEAFRKAWPDVPPESEDAIAAWARSGDLLGAEAAFAACAGVVEAVRRAGPGVSRVAVLEGPAGCGRSSVLEEAGAMAQSARVLALGGRPGGDPRSLLREPLREALRAAGSPAWARDVDRRVLAEVDPALARPDDPPLEPLAPADARLRVVDALLAVLRGDGSRAALLLLDDVDEADEESREIVRLLVRALLVEGRHGRESRVGVVVSATSLGSLGGEWDGVARTHFAPLDEGRVAELVDRLLPGLADVEEAARRLHRGVGGAPGAIQDWLESLLRARAIRRDGAGFAADFAHAAWERPPDRTQALAVLLDGRPEVEQALLRALAIVPAPVGMGELAAWLGLGETVLATAAAGLESRALARVLPSAQGPRVVVASEAVRGALASLQAEAVRRDAGALLGPAAGTLEPADLACVALAAGRRDEAARLLETSVRESERRGDPARTAALAARWAEAADGPSRLEARASRARALLALDRLDEAEAEVEAAAREAGDGSTRGAAPPRDVDDALLRGKLAMRRGLFADALAQFRSAVESGSAPWDVRLEHARALSAVSAPEAEDALAALLAETGEGVRSRVLLAQGAHFLRAQRTEAAQDVLREALDEARRAGTPADEASCENNLGIAALRLGRDAEAARHLERAARLREEAGALSALASTLTNLANLELSRGRHARAARHAARCLQIQERIGSPRGELLALANLGAAEVGRERLRTGAAALERAHALLDRVPDGVVEIAVRTAWAELLTRAGRFAEARAAGAAARREARERGLLALELAAAITESGAVPVAEAVALLEGPLAAAPHVRRDALGALAEALVGRGAAWRTPFGPVVLPGAPEEAREAASAALAAAGPALSARPWLAAAAACAASDDLSGVEHHLDGARAAGRGAPPSVAAALAAARGWLAARRDDLPSAEEAYGEAMAILRGALRHVPASWRDAYLSAPERSGVREALIAVRQRRLDAARDGGWFEVLEPARPAAQDPVPAARDDKRDRREASRLREVLAISAGINALLPVRELLARVLQSAMGFMDADRGFIVLGPPEALEFAMARDRQGREVPQAEFAISRGVLAEVARTKEAVISSDARTDARFVRQASVLALDLRSVLVAPLVAGEDVIGAIYLDNLQSSGVFGEQDRDLLALLATQAAVAVQNARLHETSLEKEVLDAELALARTIQQGLLPDRVPHGVRARVAAAMEPAREVGGDWYDFMEGAEGALRIAIGDVSGKGVPAGLFMIMARTVLRSLAPGGTPLPRVLAEANDVLESQIEDDKFTTLALLEASPDGRRVRVCLAGHEPPLIVRAATGEVELLPEGGLALGMLPDIGARLEEREVELAPGDLLACYSDGVTECRDPAGGFYGRSRLVEVLRRSAAGGADAAMERLRQDLDRFRASAERSDDVTLVILEAT